MDEIDQIAIKKKTISIISKKVSSVNVFNQKRRLFDPRRDKKLIINNYISNEDGSLLVYDFIIETIKIAERKMEDIEKPPPYIKEEVFDF